ncbi:MAG: hypothetical protein J7559_19275, partial [Cohnella sp.]|nr:hypothetical protein [Cohnella sp.]
MVQTVLCICVIFGLVACDKMEKSPVASDNGSVIESSAAVPSLEHSASPVPSVEPAGEEHSIDVMEAASDPLGDLQLYAKSTENGFQIVDSNGMDLIVEKTYVSPPNGGVNYGVHIVNRTDEHGFRKDAI